MGPCWLCAFGVSIAYIGRMRMAGLFSVLAKGARGAGGDPRRRRSAAGLVLVLCVFAAVLALPSSAVAEINGPLPRR